MSGVKHDSGKAPMDLIPTSALIAEAKVLEFGKTKYGAHNWRGGLAYSRLIAAALRHLTSFNNGEDVDPETGLSHIAHARCCTGFLLEMIESRPDMDDRYKDISWPHEPDSDTTLAAESRAP